MVARACYPRIMIRPPTLIVLLFAVMAASCTSAIVASPWPVNTSAGDCRALAGTYAPTGQGQTGYAPHLGGYLFASDPQAMSRAYQADRMEIVLDAANAIHARALNGGNELAAITVPCDHGVAHVPPPPLPESAGIDKLDTWLQAGADGALLVKRSEDAGGFYSVVPGDFGETRWYRFARIAAP